MMAESEIQSHIGHLDALQLLADVLNVLQDPATQVVDDTCVEKLLSWLTELASKPGSQCTSSVQFDSHAIYGLWS